METNQRQKNMSKSESLAKNQNTNTMEHDFPDKVSRRVVDAWVAIPPCDPSSSHPYCHVQCPYFYECYPKEYDEDE